MQRVEAAPEQCACVVEPVVRVEEAAVADPDVWHRAKLLDALAVQLVRRLNTMMMMMMNPSVILHV